MLLILELSNSDLCRGILTSLDSFFAKSFVPGTKASWKPLFEVLKKRDHGQKSQNPTNTVQCCCVMEVFLPL